MVAMVLWAALAFEIGCYLLLVFLLDRVGWQSGPAIALCIALAVSWRTGFILLTFRLARVAPRPAWALAETGAFVVTTALMMFAPLMRRASRGEADRAPVLLLHGWNCNSGIWWPLRRVLRHSRAGDVHTLDLAPWRSLDGHVAAVRDKIEQMTAAAPHDRVALVGHSMGGVVGRLYVASEEGQRRVARLITIGSPHHGTTLGQRALDPSGRELGAGSARLAHIPPAPGGVALTALYSEIDNFIAPQSSALLEGAENLSCGDLGHLQMLLAAPVLQAIAQRLEHTR